MNKDVEFLQRAILLGKQGVDNGIGGPFGAVVVRNGEIIGEGCNHVLSTNDPTAHAEVVAIRDACKTINSFQLDDCVIYSSCEPCPMCLGAIYWSRPARLVFASGREDARDAGFDDDYIYKEVVLPIEERSIPTSQMRIKEGEQLFNHWIENFKDVEY